MNTIMETLQEGKIAVMATDTLYGIVGRALSKSVVERIYEVKGRDENKPFLILIASIDALAAFGVELTDHDRSVLAQVWPGAVTVVMPIDPTVREEFAYLHRGHNTLAFRLPDDAGLHTLLTETGPLVAPSANPQGKPPAKTIDEAQAYFGDSVDHYEDAGVVEGEPSTIISFQNGEMTVIRQGVVRIV